MEIIAAELAKRGQPAAVIEKVLRQFFARNWGDLGGGLELMRRAVKSTKASPALSLEGKRRLDYFTDRCNTMVVTIRELVEMESPSDDKAAVDRLAQVVAEKFAAFGGAVRVHRSDESGNHLQVDFGGDRGAIQCSCWATMTGISAGNDWKNAVPRSRRQADRSGRAGYEVGDCADAGGTRRASSTSSSSKN